VLLQFLADGLKRPFRLDEAVDEANHQIIGLDDDIPDSLGSRLSRHGLSAFR
jgi:hypothetical protein